MVQLGVRHAGAVDLYLEHVQVQADLTTFRVVVFLLRRHFASLRHRTTHPPAPWVRQAGYKPRIGNLWQLGSISWIFKAKKTLAEFGEGVISE